MVRILIKIKSNHIVIDIVSDQHQQDQPHDHMTCPRI